MTNDLWKTAQTNVTNFFGNLVDTHGLDLKALDFGKRESQHTRFAIIADVLPDRAISLLDVGCGFAELADYLESHGKQVDYTGIDLTPQMIEQARIRRPDLRLINDNLVLNPLNQTYDYVVSSGIFYKLGAGADHLMMEVVRSMYAHARHAVIFNAISTWATNREPEEFYADPLETLEACRALTRSIIFRHDYMPHDFTLILHKDGPTP